MAKTPRNGVVKACVRCKGEFTVHPYRAKAASFCSRSCARRSQVGERAGGWKGGRMRHSAGYVAVLSPEHPNRMGRHPYVYEHRMVAAATLGRPLKRGEIVHHINGNKADNRPENLAVMTQSEHARLHQQQKAS